MDRPDENFIKECVEKGVCNIQFFKFNESKTDVEEKTAAEILANETDSIESCAETVDFLNLKISEMENYLTETDWYVTRYSETEKAIPEEVAALRADYRDTISAYRELLPTWKSALETAINANETEGE